MESVVSIVRGPVSGRALTAVLQSSRTLLDRHPLLLLVLTPGEKFPMSQDSKQMMATLVAKKFRFIGMLTVIYMISFVGLTVLAGFARPFMATKVLGPINAGFLLIAANYGLAWVMALVYVRAA